MAVNCAPLAGATNPLGCTMLNCVVPPETGWKDTLPLPSEPAGTDAGPLMVPTEVVAELMVTLIGLPPRSGWEEDNTFPAPSNCTGETVRFESLPNVAVKFAPMPDGPFRTKPDGVRVTVATAG